MRNLIGVGSFVSLVVILASFLVSHVSFASTVRACKKLKQDRRTVELDKKSQNKKVYCSVKPQMGHVGDVVEIKNRYNYIVAVGRIIKQAKTSSIIVLTGYKPELGSMTGYPAMLRENDSQDFWTATTSAF